MEPEYSMDEVQQMTDLPATALRFWEEQFSGLDPRTDNEGNRYFTPWITSTSSSKSNSFTTIWV